MAQKAEAATAPAIQFIPRNLKPEDAHRAALLEAIEQMLDHQAHALYLDPTQEHLRISIAAPAGLTELAVVPPGVGRLVIEAIRQEAALKDDQETTIYGPFSHGVMRVEHAGIERRISVDLIPTVFGAAAVLRAMATLPAVTSDLSAMGFSSTQATAVDAALTSGSGLIVLGGPDRDWVLNTCSLLLSRASMLGRRAIMVAAKPGADVAGIARVEAGRVDADSAAAITRVAQADYTCIGVENFLAPDVARAAALAAIEHKALVICVSGGRSAPEAVGLAFNAGLTGTMAATMTMAMCQIQLPLLCTHCAKWGDVQPEDIAYFGLDPTKKTNLYIRTGCDTCHGQVTEFSQIFEICTITEAIREKMRAGMPFQRFEGELTTTPGYTKLLHRVGEAIQEGRCAPAEARHYYNWQIPPAGGAPRAPSSGMQKAV